MKKPKMGMLTALTVIFMIPPIRLANYADMYSKFLQSERCGKMAKSIIVSLHALLEQIAKISALPQNQPSSCIQQYYTVLQDSILSTKYLNVQQQNKPKTWLEEFTKAEEENTCLENIETEVSRSLGSTLPSPKTLSRTSTSYMTAGGRTMHAGVVGSPSSSGINTSNVRPFESTIYKPKTSGTLRTMSYLDNDKKFFARSPGMSGDLYVKLEMFQARQVDGLAPAEWWKKSDFRCFLPIRNQSSEMETLLLFRQQLRDLMEQQPDVEGEFTYIN